MPIADEWDALDAYMADPDGYADEPPIDLDNAEPLHIEDADTANRMLRTLARLAREADGVREAVKAEMERLAGYQRDRLAGIGRRGEWYQQGVDGFMRRFAEASGTRTLNLSNGVIEIRPASPSVGDLPDVVLTTMLADEANLNLVEARPVLRKKAVADTYKPGKVCAFPVNEETGEVMPAEAMEHRAWEAAKDATADRAAAVNPHYAVDKVSGVAHPHLFFLVPADERVNVRPTR